MKAKTIAKTIAKKMDDWLASIEDEPLRKECRKDVIVTGGSIVSMFLQEQVNDYDLYFRSTTTLALLAEYYAKQMIASGNFQVRPAVRLKFDDGNTEIYDVVLENEDFDSDRPRFAHLTASKMEQISRVEVFVQSQGFAAEGSDEEYKYFENEAPEDTENFFSEIAESSDDDKKKYRPVFMSANAITLSNKVQLILRFHGEPEDIHRNYDFVHATNYWTFAAGLVTNTEALESILARELIYRGSLYPLASIFRTRKFIQRGWSCHVGNYLKMALQLNELDLFDLDTLREQLTGVDAAYLHEVITAVKQQKADQPDFKFNSAYLCQIVDRMMGKDTNES